MLNAILDIYVKELFYVTCFDLNMFIASENFEPIGIDTKMMEFKLMFTYLWALHGYGDHVGFHFASNVIVYCLTVLLASTPPPKNIWG